MLTDGDDTNGLKIRDFGRFSKRPRRWDSWEEDDDEDAEDSSPRRHPHHHTYYSSSAANFGGAGSRKRRVMSGSETGSEGGAGGAGGRGGGPGDLASRTLVLESKRFYLDVKENSRGRFIKIAEISADGRKNQVGDAFYVKQ